MQRGRVYLGLTLMLMPSMMPAAAATTVTMMRLWRVVLQQAPQMVSTRRAVL